MAQGMRFRTAVDQRMNPGFGSSTDMTRRKMGFTPGVVPAAPSNTGTVSGAMPKPGIPPAPAVGAPPVASPSGPPVVGGPLGGGIGPPTSGNTGIGGGIGQFPPTGGIGGAASTGIAPVGSPSVGLPYGAAAARYGQNGIMGDLPGNVIGDPQVGYTPYGKRTQDRSGGGGGYGGGIWTRGGTAGGGSGEGSNAGNPGGGDWYDPNPMNNNGIPGVIDRGSTTAYDDFLRGQPNTQIPGYLEDIYNQTRQQEEGDLQKYLPSTAESPEEAALYQSLRDQSTADANQAMNMAAGNIASSGAGRGLLGSGINLGEQASALGGIGAGLQTQYGQIGRQRLGSAVERRQRREDYLAQAAEAMRGRLGGLAAGRYGYGQERQQQSDAYRQEAEGRLFDLRARGLLSEQEFQNQMAILGKQRRAGGGRA